MLASTVSISDDVNAAFHPKISRLSLCLTPKDTWMFLNSPFEGIRWKDVCDILRLRENVGDISVVSFPLRGDGIIPAGLVNKGSESQKRSSTKNGL